MEQDLCLDTAKGLHRCQGFHTYPSALPQRLHSLHSVKILFDIYLNIYTHSIFRRDKVGIFQQACLCANKNDLKLGFTSKHLTIRGFCMEK